MNLPPKSPHPSALAGDSTAAADVSKFPGAGSPAPAFLLTPQVTPFMPRVACEMHPFAKMPAMRWAGFMEIRTGALRIIATYGDN